MRDVDPAAARREIRESLTGRTLKAADNLTRVYERWLSLLEGVTPRRLDTEARATAYLTECQRITALMRDRGWDIYRRALDLDAR